MSIGEKLKLFLPPSDKRPTVVIEHKVSPAAHLLYRLNADYNPLHVDPKAGVGAGFGGVIMHGLYTWNVTCNQVLSALAGGQAAHLKAFEGNFVRPVRPGDTLLIHAWVIGPVEKQNKEWQEVRYVTKVNDERICLQGRAVMKTLPPAVRSQL